MPPTHVLANHLARGVSAACAVAWTLCVVFATQVAEPARHGATALPPDQTIARELTRGQEHRYQLAVQAGECVRVVVEQRGVDVVVQARGPEDALIAEVQDDITSRGHEDVDLVADTAGTYTFAITPAPGIIVPGSYAIRVDGRHAATVADRSRQEARTLRTVAAQRAERDDFDGATTLLERALTLTEGARGPQDQQVADVAAQLADVYLDRRDTTHAAPLYQRALAIMDDTLGREHPAPAFVRSRLARLYQLTGERLKAEALIRQGLDVIEHTLGPDHLLFVRSLTTLQALRENAGDFEQAGEILRRQLAILDKIGYADSILYAQLLSSLGGVYNMQHDARAEEVLQRSLTLCETLRGQDANCMANPLLNLGVFARDRRDFATAEAHYRRAFAIREPIVGADNPDLIPLLNNLANVYHAGGDDTRALETHFQALRIAQNALGPYHRYALISLGNIAIINTVAGHVATAIAFQRRTDAILEKQLALNMAVGSERQKLAFVRGVSERTDRTISLHLHEAPDNPDAGALAALVVLQRKGRVLDAMTDMLAAARQRITDPKDQALLDQLNTTTAHLARFALNTPEGTNPEARQTQIKELEGHKERLEGEIGARDAEFRAQMQPVTLQAVQAAIPEDAALLEFVVFRPFDPREDQHDDAYGPPHYAAYVVRKDAAPRGVDLGPAHAIDDAVATLREALRDPTRRDLRRQARALDEQVMGPLQVAIGDARRLLVSPDGDLNLVPFDALIDAQGRYRIERYAITYLTSGRDLLRMQVARVSQSAPIIVADPLFGEPAPAARAGRRSSSTTGDDLSAMYFGPLAATAAEGRAIKGLFPEATLFTGRRATKAALQRAEAPRMLHIASHGFFLRDATEGLSSSAAAMGGTRGMQATVKVENPLLRSGLALAGANLTRDPNDDGILTALEASGLNLWGTKLVTLSACDTGVGEVRNGEGVYGLRRAFVLAGAETLVMSLWPVSDYITREMMTAYYTGLRAGLGRGDALRHAKLAMLKRKGRQHPFYWASFIQSGEWANLDGRR
jgi:CHAT domain-containing protein/tetratricopeptide (TPR) repeat protein